MGIRWADYDAKHKRVMKHPSDKAGNDQWVDLTKPCCAIIEAMVKVKERIPTLRFRTH